MTLLPNSSTLLLPFREGAQTGARPLRVGVVLDAEGHSPWVDALLTFMRQVPAIEVRVLPLAYGAPGPVKRPSWLMERLYAASRARFDPFGEVAGSESGPAFAESAEAIRAVGCGTLIWLARGKDPGISLSGIAERGVFTIRLGERDRGIPFWDEAARGLTTSGVTIYWHECSFARGRAIRKIETPTFQGIWFTRNAEEPLVAAIRTLAGLCMEMRKGGREFEERLRGFPEERMDAFPAAGFPSGLEAGRFLLRKLAGSARSRWAARGKTGRWFVAMRRAAGSSIADPGGPDWKGFQEVPLPQGVEEMADPFVWENGGRDYLFFEEAAAGSSKGRIAWVEVFENGGCSEMRVALERPYHLSYPCIVAAGSEVFLLPESQAAGCVELYRFSRFPDGVELVARPAEGVELVDTTPLFLDDRWYFFTTTVPPFMESFLFWSDRLDGGWRLHPASPISCSVRNSRSAGAIFRKKGRLYRPTQDCSVRYGYAIQVNEIVRLTPTDFEERPVNWIAPAWSANLGGTHTWNESTSLQVVDGLRAVRQSAAPAG